MKSSRHIYGRLGGAHPSRIKALSPAAWYQPGVGVTGTLTASNWADQSGNGRDLAQGTAGNQPIYLPYSGTAYAYLPAVAGNTLTAPNETVTGSKVFTLDVALNDYTPAADVTLVSKTSGNDGFSILWLTTDKVRLVVGDGASLTNVDSDATGITDAARKSITITWADGVGATFAIDGVTLGSQVAAAKTLTNAAVVCTVGSTTSIGKVYGFSVGSVYNLDPSTFAETSTNGATAVASTGETWTLNSTGAKPAQIVKSPQIMFDGVNDFLVTSTFNLSQPITIYAVWRQNVWDSTDTIYECSTNTAWYNRITQNGSTPDLKFSAASGGTKISAANANAALGAKVITTTIGNGASGLFQINNTTALTGDYGTFGTTGLQIAADTAGGARWSAITFWEFIMFNAAHTAAQRAVVQAYLAARHGIAL